jgi:hypothetical protein
MLNTVFQTTDAGFDLIHRSMDDVVSNVEVTWAAVGARPILGGAPVLV